MGRARHVRRWSARAHVPRSTSTASGVASRVRARRRSSRPTPTPRFRARLVADMDPTRPSRGCANFVTSIAPKGVEVNVTKLNEGDWIATPIDHPATQAAAACLKEVFGEDPLYPARGRLDPRRRKLQQACSACPSFCSASPSLTTRRTRRTRACAWTISRAACGTLVRYWQLLSETKL